jgi:MFS family permease
VSRKFDYLGCISGVSGLILINFALNQAPIVGWAVPYVPVLLVLGFLIILGFFYVELYVAKNPLFPARGLQPQALLALACIAAGYASHGIWIYYLYLFEERIRHKSPLLTTAGLIPVAPVGIAFAMSTNFLIKKIHVSRVMFIAMICFCLGTILIAFAPEHQTYWAQTFLSIVVAPGGMNLSFPAGTILLSSAMPREYQGKAASLVGTVVNYSIASGLGLAGSVERNVNRDGNSPLKGYRSAWYLAIGFSGAGVLISIYFLWSLRRPGRT